MKRIIIIMIFLLILCLNINGETHTTVVTNVILDKLVKTIFSNDITIYHKVAQRRGVSGLLRKNKQTIGSIILGVFQNHKTALKIYDDYMMIMSVGPST